MHVAAHLAPAVASVLHPSRLGAQIAAALLFVIACIGLALLRRRLAARARTEEAEALLGEAFLRLDDPQAGSDEGSRVNGCKG